MNKDLQNSIRSEVAEDELSRQLHLIIAADRIAKHNKDYNKEWSSLIYKINNGNAEMGYILGLSVHSINKSRSEINKKIDLSSKV